MKYEKALAEIVLFGNEEFMTATWEGYTCYGYKGCTRVVKDPEYLIFDCDNFYHCYDGFRCTAYSGYSVWGGFVCRGF